MAPTPPMSRLSSPQARPSPSGEGLFCWAGGYLEALLRSGTFKYDRCMSDNKRVIPDEAVEAAAKVTYQGLYDDEAWEDVTPADRMPYEDQARAALEAAAPYMLGDLLGALDAVRALVYDNTLADGRVMHAINPEAIRSALEDNPHRETGITIRREVEVEDGLHHVFWTAVDRESGYNKTFRTEEEAKAHAAVLTNPYRSRA